MTEKTRELRRLARERAREIRARRERGMERKPGRNERIRLHEETEG